MGEVHDQREEFHPRYPQDRARYRDSLPLAAQPVVPSTRIHASVLLRTNHAEDIFLGWLKNQCEAISALAQDAAQSPEASYQSLNNIMRIASNFMPSLSSVDWLTLQGAFSTTATNLLHNLNAVFGDLVW